MDIVDVFTVGLTILLTPVAISVFLAVDLNDKINSLVKWFKNVLKEFQKYLRDLVKITKQKLENLVTNAKAFAKRKFGDAKKIIVSIYNCIKRNNITRIEIIVDESEIPPEILAKLNTLENYEITEALNKEILTLTA